MEGLDSNHNGNGNGRGGAPSAAPPSPPRRSRGKAAPAEFPIHDNSELAAWTASHRVTLHRAVAELARGLSAMEDGESELAELSSLRRYRRSYWRQCSEAPINQAQHRYRAARDRAVAARNEIHFVAMDLVRHCAALAGGMLDETALLARLLDLANEVAGMVWPATAADDDEMPLGSYSDRLLAGSMQLLVVLEDEARRYQGYAKRR